MRSTNEPARVMNHSIEVSQEAVVGGLPSAVRADTMSTMSDGRKYLVNTQKAVSETIDGETIIIHLETGSYYSLNPSGTALWNAILGGRLVPAGNEAIDAFMERLVNEELVIQEPSVTDGAVEDASSFPNPEIEKYEDMQEMLLADPIHDVDTAGWPKLKEE